MTPLPPISLLPPLSSIALICSLAAALLLSGLSHIRPAPVFRGPPVLLPHTGSPRTVDELPSDIVVRLTADGNRFLETGWAPDNAFLPAVTRLRVSRPSARLLVQADTRVPFRDVRQLLVDLRAIGVHSAILVVAPLAEHQRSPDIGHPEDTGSANIAPASPKPNPACSGLRFARR